MLRQCARVSKKVKIL